MKNLFISLVLLFALSGPIRADQPEFVVPTQTIEGADQPIPFGEIVTLSPSPIKSPPKYLVSVSYQWRVLVNGVEKKQGVRTFSDGSIVFGGNPSQKIQAVLSTAYLFQVRVGDKPDGAILQSELRQGELQVVNVTIVGSAPPSPAPPGPQPQPPSPQPDGPEPTLPEGLFSLAKKSRSFVLTLNIDPAKRATAAQALAGSFESVAQQIASGSITSIQDALVKTLQGNQQALTQAGANASDWRPFGTSLQTEMKKLQANQRLVNVGDLRQVYVEVAQGLRSIK